MKKLIALALTLLLVSSVYAAKTQTKKETTSDLKEMIAKELGTNTQTTGDDVVLVENETNINDDSRTSL